MKVDNSIYALPLFFNPFWSILASYLSGKCVKCGQERLLSVFDKYAGEQHVQCKSCSIISFALAPLLHLIFLVLMLMIVQ